MTAHYDHNEIEGLLIAHLATSRGFTQGADTKVQVQFRYVDRDTKGHQLEADVTIVQDLGAAKP
jgi:hypothetical protein